MAQEHPTGMLRCSHRARGIWIVASGLLLVPTLTGTAGAFDARRSGFALEIGIGPALSSSVAPEPAGKPQTDRQTLRGAALSRFRIGAGVSDRWMLTYVNDVAWTLESYKIVNEALFATGLTGVGTTVFLGPAGSSWTIEAAIGLSSLNEIGGGAASGTGTGIELGVGREVTRGCLVRLTFGHGSFEDLDDRVTIGATVSRIWY